MTLLLKTLLPEDLWVTLNSEHLENAAEPVLQEAIAIAKGLMESRFETLNSENSLNSVFAEGEEKLRQVDWLILAGKTCSLVPFTRFTL